ncbi:MAG: hypothetical protein A2940_00375 [Candidatus Wildermuthbacteria bacterium RIFCSPLOWO2_01_FULL_48_29]|uniref:Response regulatory domain-containing protein n=1 Tax=Candidatus Wildermuthbacteria bacterium RIFCSPLOWO2_01_FULL_48_29 TaxID=1802462 RepID=A0A1G2RMM6_9BACT|nr:MAG: hypothetical protein A2940_00375 [Candidatus Wildermuthbacteria bacterium RIFCSPLOWO2_01_FULL_48_29]
MKKILLVEDDPLLIDIYTTKLQQSGFDVKAVEHGEKAVEEIREEKPDIVLLDIVLPHMDGWDILQQMQTAADLKHIPVVILSNLGQKEEIEKGLRLGAAQYLIKAHYTPSQIVEEVVKLIGSL